MGNSWDNLGRGFQGWCSEWGAEVLRTLKPGGYALVFGGTRTYHRLTCGLEDAGFEIRDSIHWIYGSGFPKSRDISKAIDSEAGAKREVIGKRTDGRYAYEFSEAASRASGIMGKPAIQESRGNITAPATDAAKEWEGWGTALKPAYEPIVVARKPLAGKTVAANILEFGTGGLNIDGCRVGETTEIHASKPHAERNGFVKGFVSGTESQAVDHGRWPPNLLLSDEAAAELDSQSGQSISRKQPKTERRGGRATNFAMSSSGQTHSDSGGASRFFPVFRYQAKAPKSERPVVEGIKHPTVKPLALIRWLARLVTQPGGYVLDPFAGSGTTAEACELEGFDSLLIERDPDYIRLINKRMSKYQESEAA
jgi:site-specific DNA-methyltransferase (adenine-specific)